MKNLFTIFSTKRASLKNALRASVLVIFLLGTLLRFTNLNWDSFQALHPDERNIAWAVTRINFFDQMNPKFFAYGGLPVYLYRALGEIVAAITHEPGWLTDWGKINLFGRTVSAILSSLSIFLIYEVGALYFSSTVGLLAAFFLAFTPWAIREAHFSTTEAMLVFFLLILLKQGHSLFKEPTLKGVLKAGMILGLSIGAKTTSFLFAIIPLAALSLPLTIKTVGRRIILSFILLATAAIIFLFTSPYTLLDFSDFADSMRYETGVTLGRFTVPYTLQFVGTTPYLYQLKTMLWQAGPVALVGDIGLFGLFIILLHQAFKASVRGGTRFWRAPRQLFMEIKSLWIEAWQRPPQNARRPKPAPILAIFLSFPFLYGLWAGSWLTKFARYNDLFLPFVALAAAWLLVFLFQKRSQKKFYLYICLFVYLFIGLFSAWWGLANWTIYLRPQTRIVASRWIDLNIPEGSTIYTEHWNDGLPLALPNIKPPNFKRELLTVYDPDNAAKLDYYVQKLSTGQFIILSTRRIWATMPSLSDKYPLTSKFYQMLLAGDLGYKEVATFTSYPSLPGITISDDSAEESLQVFDHPTVRIFQNTEHLAQAEIRRILIEK